MVILMEFKNWGFKRPYCSPGSGIVLAKTGDEAYKLVQWTYGYVNDLQLYCAETGEFFPPKD